MKSFSFPVSARTAEILAGPFIFAAASLLLAESFGAKGAAAVGLLLWMAFWWITRPVSISVTALLPIVINAFWGLIPNEHVISQYFSDIVVLLLGSDLICLTWTTTGFDRRISVRALSVIGPSVRQQIAVWLVASTVLSIFLPNVVVAAIFCPIAAAMLRASGITEIAGDRTAALLFLAIGWGSGIGGFGSPIGSSANLVAVSYIEELLGHEFMYVDWVVRFLPLLAAVTLVNLLFLLAMRSPVRELSGTRDYFRTLYESFGPMRRGEWVSFSLFAAATLLAFLRPLFADALPAMKPAYIFLALGLLLFFLHDEKDEPMLTWKYAESHAMWGMMFLFASGMAIGRLLIETDAVTRLAELFALLPLDGGFATMLAFCAFSAFFSEISSNTAAASITLPIIISLTGALSLPPAPYIIASVAAVNCAYILPVSTRAIPVGYGLDAGLQIRRGLILALLSLFATAVLCYLLMQWVPLYQTL